MDKKEMAREKRDNVTVRASGSTFLRLHTIVATKSIIILVIASSQKTSYRIDPHIDDN